MNKQIIQFYNDLQEFKNSQSELSEQEFNKYIYGEIKYSLKIRILSDSNWIEFIMTLITCIFNEEEINDISNYFSEYYLKKKDMYFMIINLPEQNKYNIEKNVLSVIFNSIVTIFLKLFTNGRFYNKEEHIELIEYSVEIYKKHKTVTKDTTLLMKLNDSHKKDNIHKYGIYGHNLYSSQLKNKIDLDNTKNKLWSELSDEEEDNLPRSYANVCKNH